MMKALSNIEYPLGSKVYAKFLASMHDDEYDYVPGIVVGISYDEKHDRLNYEVYCDIFKKTYKLPHYSITK